MGNYTRKAKRKLDVKEKAPRCCGRHMFLNKYGLWQCRKCGRQKFNIGSDASQVIPDELNTVETEIETETGEK